MSVVICCWNVVAVAGVDTVAVTLVVAAILDSSRVVVVVVSGFVEAVPMALVFVGGDVAPGGGVVGAVVLARDVDVLSCWPSSHLRCAVLKTLSGPQLWTLWRVGLHLDARCAVLMIFLSGSQLWRSWPAGWLSLCCPVDRNRQLRLLCL